jgi:hypothetical protein
MRKLYTLIICCCLSTTLFAQTLIKGTITDEKNQPLGFCSILVKGTSVGVSGNIQGNYVLELAPGNYTLVCQHVGYKSEEKKVEVKKGVASMEVNFNMQPQSYDLNAVVVSSKGEDPAYEIIRKAIASREKHLREIKAFEVDVYIKGQLRLRNYPKKFMGEKVDFEDGDTSKRKVIFLSETVAKYTYQEPDKSKIEVISTKVSGNSDGYGFASPQIINFYENNIQLSNNLNPRGFISPIASGALNYYKYKFAGTFYDGGKEISRIKVTPKREYEPLFTGYIDIIEKEWRIYSVQLQLLKKHALQLLDTLAIEQIYVPLKDKWVIKQQVVYPAIKIFGFDAYGSFAQVYSNFNISPSFTKKTFNNTIIKFYDSSNKKTLAYWDSIRPIPLQTDEIADYKKKDSLEQVRQSPAYLDSIDKKNNKITLNEVFMTGPDFRIEKKKVSISLPPLIDMVTFNTVEGISIRFSPDYYKSFGKNTRRSLYLSPHLQYGVNNKRFNAHLTGRYNFGTKYYNSFEFSGGKRVFQFNNAQPVTPRENTFATLLYGNNWMKVYEAWFGRVALTKGLGNGLTGLVRFDFQDRTPLENTTNFSWAKSKDVNYTPNHPVDVGPNNIPRHQAASVTLGFSWQPGAKYVELPGRKINAGSKFPTITAAYTQGLKNFLGSDVDYAKWRVSIEDDVNMKIGGLLEYNLAMGGFFNSNSVFTPDLKHFQGNRQFASVTPYTSTFQLPGYYEFSNAQRLYTETHIQYHLNGLLTNKIPGFKKLNWFLVTGVNGITFNNKLAYGEWMVGLENILKIIRVDYVRSFGNAVPTTDGIRVSFSGIIQGRKDD